MNYHLSNLAADLLTEKQFEPFVRKLFLAASRQWQTVAECCSDLTALSRDAQDLLSEHRGAFLVTYVPYPKDFSLGYRDGYAIILFVHTQTLWTMVAPFRQASLESMKL